MAAVFMTIKGRVVKGRGIGKSLGFPTANLQCKIAPAMESGVYAAKVNINNEAKNAIAIIGAPSSGPFSVEAHILDWQDDLYDAVLAVEILKKISEVEKFNDKNLFIKKIESDIVKAREWFLDYKT